jgi:hypothetical protein
MNELPNELVIEIFEKISLRNLKTFNELSKINKQFNGVYKKYFEGKVKIYDEIWCIGKKVKVDIPRNGDLVYRYYLNYPISINDNINTVELRFR